MKKSTFLIIAMLIASISFAQKAQQTRTTNYLIEESFENGIPADWTTVDEDGDGYNWGTISNYYDSFSPRTGDSAAVSASFDTLGISLNANNWMFTKAINLPAEGTYLAQWYEMSLDRNYRDSYSVYIATSTNVDDLATATPIIAPHRAEGETWTCQTISLEDYAGQTVYIAFNHQDNGRFMLAIDDFSVYSIPTTPEIELISLTETGTITRVAGESFNVGGTILNNGIPLNSYTVSYTIGDGTPVSQNITDIEVALGYNHTFEIENISIETAGEYTITITVSNPNGQADDDSDNSLSFTVNAIACEPIETLPLTEDFNSSTNYPSCWTVIYSFEENAPTISIDNSINGTNVFKFNSLNWNPEDEDYNQYLITPEFNVSTPVEISFQYKADEYYTETFRVGYSTESNDIEDFMWENGLEASDNLTLYKGVFPAETKYIAIHYYSTYTNGHLAIENINVNEFTESILSAEPETIDFGTVIIGDEPIVKEIFVTAANLENGISVSMFGPEILPVPFEVSIDSTTFTSEPITMSGMGVLYVRYVPTEGGPHEGTIILSSEGVESVEINLQGSSIDCSLANELPYVENFDTDITCWRIIDANGDEISWTLDGYTNNHKFTCYTYSNTASNDYLISEPINISEAGEYVVMFDYSAMSSYAPEKMKVFIGTAPTIDEMTAEVVDLTEIVNEEYENSSNNVTITTPGTYYLGFKAYSDAYSYGIFIDNISVIEAPTRPEIALTSISPAENTVFTTTTSFEISGIVTNYGIPLTSYTVSYSINDGEAVSQTVENLNIAYGETNTFTFSDISLTTPGNYTIEVTVSNPNGTTDIADDNSLSTVVSIISCDIPITSFPFSENFDNGINSCWTIIDQDGDGNNWVYGESPYFMGNNESAGCVYSESYSLNYGNPLNPKNWLITPAMTLPQNADCDLSFYVAAHDYTDFEEHYGIYVSTTTTDPSAFNLLFEETLEDDNSWRQRTVDLDSYAGQTIYIAFRHFDCTNMYALLIDDVTVTAEGGTTEIDENIASSIAVYPNPTNSIVTIANAEGQNITIVNSLGQVVANIENASANQTIDVSNFANGTYFVKVNAEVVKLNVVK